MAIEWIEVGKRLPDDRRKVLTWGTTAAGGLMMAGNKFLGETKFNPSPTGGRFDIERESFIFSCRVTHWAEINGPANNYTPPLRKP